MNENMKVDIMNITLAVMTVLSCFFAGYLFTFVNEETKTLITIASGGLLILGIILSQVKAVLNKE